MCTMIVPRYICATFKTDKANLAKGWEYVDGHNFIHLQSNWYKFEIPSFTSMTLSHSLLFAILWWNQEDWLEKDQNLHRGGEILKFLRQTSSLKNSLIYFNDVEQSSAFRNLPTGSYESTDFYWRYHPRRSERALPTVPAGSSKVTVWWSAQDANQNTQNCCDGLAVPGGNSQVHRVPLHPRQGRYLWIVWERW